MAIDARDQNRTTVWLGTLNTDGVTPKMVKGDATDHYTYVDDDTTGSDLSGDIAARDQNFVTCMLAVSSADGTTPTPVYVTASGLLMVDSS